MPIVNFLRSSRRCATAVACVPVGAPGDALELIDDSLLIVSSVLDSVVQRLLLWCLLASVVECGSRTSCKLSSGVDLVLQFSTRR